MKEFTFAAGVYVTFWIEAKNEKEARAKAAKAIERMDLSIDMGGTPSSVAVDKKARLCAEDGVMSRVNARE